MGLTVKEFIKKYNIKMTKFRIYDEELADEVNFHDMNKYMNCKVVDVGTHNGDAVVNVKSVRE